MTVVAIYPGTFDPITNGHIDIVERGAVLFDRLILAVAENPNKNPLFNLQERVSLAQQALAHVPNVTIQGFNNLLVHYTQQINAKVILRGLRAVSDFEYEFQLASMNRRLNTSIETVFLTPAEQYAFISSSLVKEVARLGGDIGAFVTQPVQQALMQKFSG